VAYLAPSEFVTKMVDAGESKIFMSSRDTVIRAYMAGAILALAAWFAVTINVQTGLPLVGAVLFPVGFVMLYLLGFDLLTGVFVLSPPCSTTARASRSEAYCEIGDSSSSAISRAR
jgi:formate transporter